MNPAHVIITCEAYVTVSGGRRVPFDSTPARDRYPHLAVALDDLPLVGAFITDPRDNPERRDPDTGKEYIGCAPPLACHVRGPQNDASVKVLWEETWCDKENGTWQAIAGIFRCTFGTQTVDNPDFALGHQLNGDPILLVDILPKGRAFESFTEEEKEKLHGPFTAEK